MAASPKDLTRKTWSKLKPVLMKETKFGDALDAYAEAFDQFKKFTSTGAFERTTASLQLVKAKLGVAREVATKDKRTELIEAMKAYDNLIAKAVQDVTNVYGEYKKKLDLFVSNCDASLKTLAEHYKTAKLLDETANSKIKLCTVEEDHTPSLPSLQIMDKTLGNVYLAAQRLRNSCDECRHPEGLAPIASADQPKDKIQAVEKAYTTVTGLLENTIMKKLAEAMKNLKERIKKLGK